MISLRDNRLDFQFPEVHENAKLSIEFQRTLRIPDDNREYPLPPGLGRFPMFRVDDYTGKVPDKWQSHGGVFMPMYQSEALWISFPGGYPFSRYPMAVKIATGKINAVTGEEWIDGLSVDPQNYLVVPDQPWLDGYCVTKGSIRQFVAMPLGEGYTAEEQITGEVEHGGIQISVHPMKADVYKQPTPPFLRKVSMPMMVADASMGLAPGGLMRQEIYEDEYGIDVWDTEVGSRCFVHIVNSVDFFEITSVLPPIEPPTAHDYADAGLPWFDYYDAELTALDGAAKLAGLDSVAAMKIKKQDGLLSDNAPLSGMPVHTIGAKPVKEGRF